MKVLCPKCHADLTGPPIPKEKQAIFAGTHFGRRIGISDGDSVGFWKCPECYHEWPREGGSAEQARRNILRDRAK
jgi:hypothetical protein